MTRSLQKIKDYLCGESQCLEERRKPPRPNYFHIIMTVAVLAIVAYIGSEFISFTKDVPWLKQSLTTICDKITKLEAHDERINLKIDDIIKDQQRLKIRTEALHEKVNTLNRIHKLPSRELYPRKAVVANDKG